MSSLTSLNLELYEVQSKRWPASGRHIMAQYDESTITVYQAFKPSIAHYAVENQKFGGPSFSWFLFLIHLIRLHFTFISINAMTWIKPNFAWMMYRSGWATKKDQERILAIKITLQGFQTILSNAVASTYGQVRNIFASEEEWNIALKTSDIRLQWDPDHGLVGEKLNRRAIQLGIRGKFLEQYSNEWIQSIEDITEFVKEQHKLVVEKKFDQVMTPFEMVYNVPKELSERIGLEIVNE
ncbi:15595_t:CDS:2 [Cetraspora pellucida]|uniref:15595_t:CDS:1 n=1 Tax=Cetraspora pellucida TaxID=1433469 RepID=A0ACA9L5M8_9GLOM|nr:15595_t:CDS:2 [Cetraspora pellucida]